MSEPIVEVGGYTKPLNANVMVGVTPEGVPTPIKVTSDGSISPGGMAIPLHDYILNSYHGTTNNLATVVYKSGGAGGTTVATLTLAYVGGVPVSDNAKLLSVTRS